MSRNALLVLAAAGLLVAGGLLVVFRQSPMSGPMDPAVPPGEPARSTSGRVESGSSIAPRKKRDRSPDAPAAVVDALTGAIADLEKVEAEDFAARLGKVVAGWRAEDLPTAVAALFNEDFPGDASVALKYSLLRRWASLSPVAAASWAEGLPAGQSRADALGQVALAWAELDSDSAWQWAEALPQDAARDAALVSLAYETCRENPQLALDRAGLITESDAKSRLVEHAFGVWAASDPQAALQRVREISDPVLRDSSLGALTVAWAESDPRAAATTAAEAMEAGPAQDRAVASIIQRWAQQDPDAVGQWVEAFSDGRMKENALALIASQTAGDPTVTNPEE